MSPADKKSSKSAKSAPKKAATKTAKSAAAPKSGPRQLLGPEDMSAALKRVKTAIRKEFASPQGLLILGIRTRGVVLAERLRELLEADYKQRVPMGILDITLYRDDLSALGPQPMVRDSEIPFDITDTNIVLVDDVLYTGRTIRAAMDEIIDFGRPNLIRLAVLIDRGGREYPIQADYVGKEVTIEEGAFARVHLKEIDGSDEVIAVERK